MKQIYNEIFLLSWYLGLKYEEVVKMAVFERKSLIEQLKKTIIWQQEHME